MPPVALASPCGWRSAPGASATATARRRAPRRARRERLRCWCSLFISFKSARRVNGGRHEVEHDLVGARGLFGVVIVVDASRALATSGPRAATAPPRRHQRAPLRVRPRRLHRSADRPPARPRRRAIPRRSRPALFVAVLVVVAAVRLAIRSIDVLMDRTVADADDRIRAALEQADDLVELRRVRVRQAGGRHFVAGGWMPTDTGVRQAHAVADRMKTWSSALGGCGRSRPRAHGDVREQPRHSIHHARESREVPQRAP